ncbi:hypothetical protein [Photobacterium iliopiscarium]|uniref:hypothetical protein n=1 Tax=Photobacterium iliopiscarium TaxID=56192 RepID=UPI001E555412|nr:hypothetical protein [Photobacterium iliopiscarium]MCD9465912.1 hypothetical protein [Photobacterium iliopiscarium]MCD9486867.1 hypothetical protein [Photobacterium iliopiscarium]MCF2243056.1 hypothetical protein [Photobacterium iliopiscarium]
MPTLTTSEIPKPQDPLEFESIVCDAVKLRWNSPNFQLNGRSGQSQNGVDIFGFNDMSHISIQCKKTNRFLSEAIIRHEIELARNFRPIISNYYIATTLNRDVKLQNIIRSLSDENIKKNSFTVSILFWEDIVSDLNKDPSILIKHYPWLLWNSNDNDQELLQKIRNILPFHQTIKFLQDNPFPGKFFNEEKIKDLVYFYYDIDGPMNMFKDQRLESIRKY